MSESEEQDRVSMLEQQMLDLKQMLEEERERRKEEKLQAETKVRVLESRLQEAEQKGQPKKSNVPRVANLPKKSGTVHRDVAVTTPRTSDNLFAAMPTKRTDRPAPLKKKGSQAATAAPHSSTSANQSRHASPSRGEDKNNAEESNNDQSAKATALQHSWDKFCFIARQQFTPQELSLVSAETLRSLLDHYRIRVPVERAQIEAQWALLQEGKETVGGAATPRNMTPSKRGPVKQAVHPSEFHVEKERLKPHLSRRSLLNSEPTRGSNPNNTTSKSGFVRTHSGTVLLTPRSAAPSNPNEVATLSTPRRYCFQRADSAPRRSETPRGMRHVSGPFSGTHKDRGIYSEGGSTASGPDRSKAQSIRTGIDTTSSSNAVRKGLRTFAEAASPVREHRPSKIVSTPPHLLRQRLSTDQLSRGGNWQRARPNQSPIRAPFATD